MKNLYRVTRPAWAMMDKSETAVILVASLVLGIYGAWGEALATKLFALLRVPDSIYGFWRIADVALVTFGCILLISFYKKLRVGCYPSTFIYCFNMPEASNPSGKSQVVGYFHIRPEFDDGDITIAGASFFWDDGLDAGSRVGFKSIQVYSTEENGETTCHIRFSIDEEDHEKRNYRHGLLKFRLTNAGSRTASNQDRDAYAGYLRIHKDVEIQDVGVQSKGYAERWRKGTLEEADIQATLRTQGGVLFAKLNALSNTTPPPSLWRVKDHMQFDTNIWGHQIPTPQSAILSPTLRQYIDGYLSKVLALYGVGNEAIERFNRLARAKAKLADPLVGYERDLKAGLIGLTVPYKENEALTHRAQVICREISQFLDGDSLLDIGCGNGLIANLVRSRFREFY